MAPTRRSVLGMAAMSIGLAGCSADTGGGEGSPEGTTAGGSTTTGEGTTVAGTTTGGTSTTSEATTAGTGGVSVRVDDHPELGQILVDGDGVTLYMFDADERGAGASACSGGCAEAWPPLVTDGAPAAGEGVSAELTTFERGDGSTQVAAEGWPLYHWQGDGAPGDATGQGVNDVWWVLRPDGTPVRPDSGDGTTVQVASHPDHGEILVDAEGMTLYMFDSDTRGQPASTCAGDCAEAWPPLTTDGEPSAGDAVTAELSTFDRSDGSTQVAANGWPLYYFASDEEPGDYGGQGVNDDWWMLDASGVARRENVGGGSGGGGPGSY